jgi:hypothetical protein
MGVVAEAVMDTAADGGGGGRGRMTSVPVRGTEEEASGGIGGLRWQTNHHPHAASNTVNSTGITRNVIGMMIS